MGCSNCDRQVSINVSQNPIKAPTMNADGSITYPDGDTLPIIDGYREDPDNDRNLLPVEGNGCAWRITGIMLRKDGTYQPHHVCRNSKCAYKAKPVTFPICHTCPYREG